MSAARLPSIHISKKDLREYLDNRPSAPCDRIEQCLRRSGYKAPEGTCSCSSTKLLCADQISANSRLVSNSQSFCSRDAGITRNALAHPSSVV